jgi:hypothetical protein
MGKFMDPCDSPKNLFFKASLDQCLRKDDNGAYLKTVCYAADIGFCDAHMRRRCLDPPIVGGCGNPGRAKGGIVDTWRVERVGALHLPGDFNARRHQPDSKKEKFKRKEKECCVGLELQRREKSIYV